MGLDSKNSAKLRRLQWEMQRAEALMRDEIARCYRQYSPAQIRAFQYGKNDLPAIYRVRDFKFYN